METLVTLMHEYQKKHKVKGKCITNTTYLVDCLRMSGVNARAKAVIAYWFDHDGRAFYNCVHMVVELGDDTIVDPSYEIDSIHDCHYVDKLHLAYPKCLEGAKVKHEGIGKKEKVEAFLQFIEFAKRINDGEVLVTDREYYNAQADYVEHRARRMR